MVELVTLNNGAVVNPLIRLSDTKWAGMIVAGKLMYNLGRIFRWDGSVYEYTRDDFKDFDVKENPPDLSQLADLSQLVPAQLNDSSKVIDKLRTYLRARIELETPDPEYAEKRPQEGFEAQMRADVYQGVLEILESLVNEPHMEI